MNMKQLWNVKSTRIWLSVTAIVLVILLTLTLVLTQVSFISGTFDILFGGKRVRVGESANLFVRDYETKAEVLKAANDFNITVAEEGSILLKNEQSLPLATGAKITVFGKNSVNLVMGGSGSGGVKSENVSTIYQSLTDAGFTYNTTLFDFYSDTNVSGKGRKGNPSIGSYDITGFGTGETPIDSYTDAIRSSYTNYNDAAIVVISRIGGEGFDLPRTMVDNKGKQIAGARNMTDHYLQLDANETALLKEANDNFNNVVVVINCSQAMELGFLDDPNHYAYQPNIRGAVWIGSPGSSGIMALGKILNGTVNPSGHTVDTFARDFTKDPTWQNFGDNKQTGTSNKYTVNGEGKNAYFVEYEEGIYVGYRYYETRGMDNEQWYKENVVFPFGYGKSYTNFEWTTTPTLSSVATITKDDVITVSVNVKNIGDFDGKDVIQLYYTPPYTAGGIQKPHVVLGAFEKTKLIPKAGEDTVTLTLRASDMKSYDYNDANGNGHKGYELEAGTYDIKIAKNAHEIIDTISYTVASDVLFMQDEKTGYTVENRFDDVSSQIEKANGYMTRDNWEMFPTSPTAEGREISQAFFDSLQYTVDDAGKPWQANSLPQQGISTTTPNLSEMAGKSYDDPLWDELLNRLSPEQMSDLIRSGAFGSIDILSIGKPKTTDADGPVGFTNFMSSSDAVPIYDTCSYVSECIVGATWNKEIAHQQGIMVGNEALVGDERGDKLPYSGWYAPAVNIHRSPFAGRNWEYYSEDPLLSGEMAAQVCSGANEKGVYTFVKHFAVNDQETHRDLNGLLTWLNEQSMREIYLKPFEIAVKQGGTTAMMSSFNRIGTVWAGGNYALLTEVLRNEWGFRGMVITDYGLEPFLNINQMIRGGGDLFLNQGGTAPQYTATDATAISVMRKSVKNVLYTVANSNAMSVAITGYKLPVWQVVLISVDVAVAVLLGLWGYMVISKERKKKKA